ncbi:MAG: NAD(P)-dependent oxidoreductase [Gammaproteobacteria bacterium]|nr:NAD(P)-dependent oxidoreductase [Gammaproteobacteria bacterium]MCH9744216.1 NAD(P)-dependent oxidoreductase [Gammaproteobacteria bacterium]
MKKITLIGLGKMGSVMAEKILDTGLQLTVYNRTVEKTGSLKKLGAIAAQNVESAVKDADIIITSLIDDEALFAVTERMLPHLKQGSIHISTSTILPKTADLLEKRHDRNDIFYIAAPIIGIPNAVKAGQALIFCAGNGKAVETILPLLKIFSNSVENLGSKVTDANVFKICMNYTTIAALELISELYAFAEKSGLNTEYIQGALHHIYAHPGIKHYIDKIHQRNFDQVNFDMRGGDKDIRLFQQAFTGAGVNPDIANILESKFTQALASGMEEKDWSAISEVVRQRSGLK